QLGRGQREAEVARGGLKRPQTVQGRQSGSHLAAGYMSLFHAKGYKLSFVELRLEADIIGSKLAPGAENVYVDRQFDDKSSCARLALPERGDPPCRARALSHPPRALPVDHPRSPGRRPLLERHCL